MKQIRLSVAVVGMSVAVQLAWGAKSGDFYHEDRHAPMESTGHLSPLAEKLPFAYYPSINRMEVAVKLPEEAYKEKGFPDVVQVVIKNVATGEKAGEGRVPLNARGEGQSLFDVPDFPDGEYSVEYVIGDEVRPAAKTFRRIHFPFEGTSFGVTREVFPPFTPVAVSGRKVSVVGRTYTLNGQGLFDKVETLGRDILARPMRLVMQDGAGKTVAWKNAKVAGKKLFDDEARFETQTVGGDVVVTSVVTVQEDGAARVRLTFAPKDAKKPAEVSHLKLQIALKDAEASLLHYVADEAMRFNYGGALPRVKKGEAVEWYVEPWDHWVVIRNRTIASPGATEDTPLWDSTKCKVWHSKDYRAFVPYIWLGAEERGLAFFMETEEGCELGGFPVEGPYDKVKDAPVAFMWEAIHHASNERPKYGKENPIQRITRKGGAVTLEVDLFQRPVTLSEPRTIEFGLMASPGKPMMGADFRTRRIPWGIGPVVCWGGWLCASKYPTLYSWDIVDRIQGIRKARRPLTDEDRAWLAKKAEAVKERWGDRKVHDSWGWLEAVTHFSEIATDHYPWQFAGGVYFEEHNSDVTDDEWIVFQDEWGNAEFARFQDKPPNWGVGVPSYQDFALYMANEWMRRGVSLYFDNAYPKRAYTERFGCAWRDADNGRLLHGTTLWAHREYFRRIFKRLSDLNRQGVDFPLDFTIHMTNTQTLPINTWATATLDFEQCGLEGDPETDPAEETVFAKRKDGSARGFQYPWPADYLRAVTSGRQTGTRGLGLYYLTGYDRHGHEKDLTQRIGLREWGMRNVHDIANTDHMDGKWLTFLDRARVYDKELLAFGYGDYARTRLHNYWAEKPFMNVSDPDVKWLALETIKPASGDAKGMVLLQSYVKQQGLTVNVSIPNAKTLVDTETGEIITKKNGVFAVTFHDIYGTRMFRWR